MAHLVAGAVVAVGLAAQVARPLAPDLGTSPAPAALFDVGLLTRAEAYRGPLRTAALAALLLRVAVPVGVAVAPVGRRAVDRLVRAVGEQRPARAGACVALAVVVLTDLVVLPLSFWAGYVHEGRWGFRTQGAAGWARDWLVGHAPAWLAAAALVGGGVVLVRRLPKAWPPVAGLAATALTALLVFAAPLVLEPLQFRFSPLPAGPLRTEVEDVLTRAGRPLDQIVVADASRRTTKENAYVSGLGATRRVVLYDTLVAGRSPDEVAVVVAHELGHDAHADLARSVVFGAAGSVVLAYVAAATLRLRRRRTGAPLAGTRPDPRAVAAVLAVLAVLAVAGLPLQTLVSRRAEAAADLAALDLTRDPETFQAMQRGLATANLGDPDPPLWARLLWSTHPSAAERLEMGRRWPNLDDAGRDAP